MDVVVARVGRPHGVRGEVTVEVRTDVPELRLRPGAVLSTDPDRGRFTVGSARDHNGRLLLTFAEVTDRTTAEGLRGVLLVADVDPEAEEAEHDAWPAARLVGLRVVTVDGREVGRVAGVLHLPAQDVLEVDQPSGATVLVPFVRAIVPQVDVDGGRVVVDPPGGLLED